MKPTRGNSSPEALDGFPASDSDPEAVVEQEELAQLVREHLAELPDKYRLPLVYAAIDGLDYEAVGAAIGVHAGTVNTLVFRGKQMLKARIMAALRTRSLGVTNRIRLDDQIDNALSDLPVWEPPAHFARRVAMAVQSERRPVTVRSYGLFWVGAAFQGAAVALVAHVGSSVISSAATSLALTLGMLLENYVRSLSLFNP